MYTIGFIGAGNMALALAASMHAQSAVRTVRLYDRRPAQYELFREQLGSELVVAAPSASSATAGTDVCFLAVKPQDLSTAAASLEGISGLVASIVAGVPLAALQRQLPAARLVRIMPNTPCLVGAMAAGYSFGESATAAGHPGA